MTINLDEAIDSVKKFRGVSVIIVDSTRQDDVRLWHCGKNLGERIINGEEFVFKQEPYGRLYPHLLK